MPEEPVIFLVSQDERTVGVVRDYCAAAAMTLAEAENAYRAVAQAKTAEPAVILLDETLDGADWRDLYKSLLAELSFTFVPILVAVAGENAEEAVEAIETGLVDLVVKPVTAVALKPRIKAMLQIKNIHDGLDEERTQLRRMLDEERHLREQLATLNEELKKLSTTDGLTGLANQRYLSDWLKTEFEVVSRYGMPMAAIMIDLDNFKKLNDDQGHVFGNFVLKGIAEIIREQSRRADVAARYGGEEFAVILPNTDGYAAVNLANRIHKAIESTTFEDGAHSARITASFGISSYPADGVNSAKDLVELADKALYAAKERGRNCVVSWADLSD